MKEVIVEGWSKNSFPKLPEPPLFVTDRKLVGDKRFGFGQYIVQLNGKFWINETYVREKPE